MFTYSVEDSTKISSLGWTFIDDFNTLAWLSCFEFMFWGSFSSPLWDLADILVNKFPNIWSHVFWVSNVLLLCKSGWFIKPSEFWVKETLSWVSFLNSSPWLWEDWFIVGSKTMNFLIDSLVTDVLLIFLDECCWFV